ncbi:MAG: peptidyl-prolyl cis-trans isomerase [Deltaproteobacteria bacterium]|nr:peptidyl-prolyl cis-trans isomerase [Deltaproteobacteria bacterium]
MRSNLSLLRNSCRALTALVVFLLIATTAPAEKIEGIVAVVDETIIMISDLRERMDELGAPLYNKAAERQVLELMVETIVVEKVYRSLGFPEVDLDEAEQYAQRTGVSVKDAVSLIMKSTLMDMMVRSRVVITENMIQEYYDGHDEYTGRLSVRLKQILVKGDELKARQALEALNEGRDFDEVAGEFSSILISGSADIGWVAIEDLSESISEAITTAGPGDIVGPLAMNDYYAIFEVMEKGLSGNKSIDDVRDEILSKLESKYQQEAFQHWLDKMMSEYFIGVYI